MPINFDGCAISHVKGNTAMSQEIPQDLLDEMSDEEVATLLEFVERLGSFETARAAIDMLSELRDAA